MATSTPERISATPPLVPPAPQGRVRKPSAKVLETQQALKTRNSTLRSAQNGQRTVVTQSTFQTALQATQNKLPPFPTARESASPEWEGRAGSFKEFRRLI